MLNRRRAILTSCAALLPWRLYAQPVPLGGAAGFQKLGPGPLWSGVPGNAPSLDLNLLSATLDASVTWTRANANATDGLFTDASGATFNTFAANAPRISVAKGLLIERNSANNLLLATVPATQTTASLGTGQYWVWVNGAGSATPSAGTATGSGFAPATNGTPSTFTLTVAGTVIVTVSGALNRFQLEASIDPTSFISSAASVLTRQVDSGTAPTAAWYNAVEGTFIIDFLQPSNNATSVGDLPTLYTDVSNLMQIRIFGTAVQILAWVANVNTGSVSPIGAISTGVPQKAAFTYVAATKVISGCLNGGPVSFATPSSLATFNQIKFGATRTGTPNDGFTRRIRYYPRALQVPELRAVTSL